MATGAEKEAKARCGGGRETGRRPGAPAPRRARRVRDCVPPAPAALRRRHGPLRDRRFHGRSDEATPGRRRQRHPRSAARPGRHRRRRRRDAPGPRPPSPRPIMAGGKKAMPGGRGAPAVPALARASRRWAARRSRPGARPMGGTTRPNQPRPRSGALTTPSGNSVRLIGGKKAAGTFKKGKVTGIVSTSSRSSGAARRLPGEARRSPAA